jgi:hypothetical protein
VPARTGRRRFVLGFEASGVQLLGDGRQYGPRAAAIVVAPARTTAWGGQSELTLRLQASPALKTALTVTDSDAPRAAVCIGTRFAQRSSGTSSGSQVPSHGRQ